DGGHGETAARAAFRRAAATGGASPGSRAEPRGAAARRTPRRARRQAPKGPPARAQDVAGGGGGHVRLRDARPGGGPHHVGPDRGSLEPHGATGENRVPGMVERVVYTGPTTQLMVRLAPGGLLQAMIPNSGGTQPYRQGTPVTVVLPSEALRVLRTDEGDGQ